MRIREVSPADPESWSGLINFPGSGIGSNAGGNRQIVMVTDGFAGQAIFTVADSVDGGANWDSRLTVLQGGRVGIARSGPSHPLHVGTDTTNGNGAHVTAVGVWTNASDRHSKEDFEEVDTRDILRRVADLPVTPAHVVPTEYLAIAVFDGL